MFASMFNNIVASTEEEDIKEHWDVKLEIKVDVKSLKRINRVDIETNEFYHFIELKNVHGKLGWLYGNADYFAFETNQYWVIVNKEVLQRFIAMKVAKKKVTSVDESLYCLYTRDKRKDVITMVKTIDLMVLATEILEKTKDIIHHKIGDSIKPEKRLKKKLENLQLK